MMGIGYILEEGGGDCSRLGLGRLSKVATIVDNFKLALVVMVTLNSAYVHAYTFRLTHSKASHLEVPT